MKFECKELPGYNNDNWYQFKRGKQVYNIKKKDMQAVIQAYVEKYGDQ